MMPDAVESLPWKKRHGKQLKDLPSRKKNMIHTVGERFFLLGCVWKSRISSNGNLHRANDLIWFEIWRFSAKLSENPKHHTKLVSHILCYPHEIPWGQSPEEFFMIIPGDSKKKRGQKNTKQQPIKYRCLTGISWFLIVCAGSRIAFLLVESTFLIILVNS